MRLIYGDAMKKRIMISGIILILVFMGAFLVIEHVSRVNFKKHVMNIIDNTEIYSSALLSDSSKRNGTLTIDALYKGAHGENYPSQYNYRFAWQEKELLLWEKDGYHVIPLDNLVSHIISLFMRDNAQIFQVQSWHYGLWRQRVTLNCEPLSQLLNTSFTTCEITQDLLAKKMTLYLDEMPITINNNQFSYAGDNHILISLNTNGISLKVNDNLKLNAFFQEQGCHLDLVINESVLAIDRTKEQLVIKASTPASIYNGLNLTFTFGDVEVNTSKFLDNNELPLTRYFTALDWDFWR